MAGLASPAAMVNTATALRCTYMLQLGAALSVTGIWPNFVAKRLMLDGPVVQLFWQDTSGIMAMTAGTVPEHIGVPSALYAVGVQPGVAGLPQPLQQR